jgi:adenosylhomocysteine nucleosidase
MSLAPRTPSTESLPGAAVQAGAAGWATRVAAISGLAAEARLARLGFWQASCAGGDPLATRREAERLVGAGADILVSFGIAGGLAPGLRPGALVVADSVLAEGGALPPPLSLREAAAARHGVTLGPVLAGSAAAASAWEKARLHRAGGALAVDLETAIVARVAAAAGIPYLVVRAIADPAERDLPEAALVRLRLTGAPDLPRILWEVARRPQQIPALIRLAGDARAALGSLARIAPSLGAALARHDPRTAILDFG